MQYKALLCDVDGTLVPNRPDAIPSVRVRQAIAFAQEKIAVGIATARSYSMVYDLLEMLQLSSPCIITGGAQIIDPTTKRIISEKLLSVSAIEAVKKVAKKFSVALTVADYGKELPVTKTYVPYKPYDIYTSPLPRETAQAFIQAISPISPVAVHMTSAWGVDDIFHVTISHPEATKQHGIWEVAKILQIETRDIIGVGEGYNDFPLLMACGLKIAVGNAVPEIKAIADYIAPSVEEDGVAHVIEKFILKTVTLTD